MEWVPITLIVFKVLVFGMGMFFAIKWHYDQDKKGTNKRALPHAGRMVAVFVLLLLGVLLLTFGLARMLGMDLGLP